MRLHGVQAIVIDEEDPEGVAARMTSALDVAGIFHRRLVVREMTVPQAESTEWVSKEHSFYVSNMSPGAVGRAIVTIAPPTPEVGGKPAPVRWDMPVGVPFRLGSVVASEMIDPSFRLLQCYVGGRAVLPPGGVAFAGPVAFAEGPFVAEVGSAITIFVENVGPVRKSFTGRLVGEERRQALPRAEVVTG